MTAPNTPPGAPGEAGRVVAAEYSTGPLASVVASLRRLVESDDRLRACGDSYQSHLDYVMPDEARALLAALLAALDAAEAGRGAKMERDAAHAYLSAAGNTLDDSLTSRIHDLKTRADVSLGRIAEERDTARAALAGMQAERDALAAELARVREDAARWEFVLPLLRKHLRSQYYEDINGPEMYLALGEQEMRTGSQGDYADVLVTRAIDAARPPAPGGA